VHSFHLPTPLKKSVSRDIGRWDTAMLRYSPVRIRQVGTKALLKVFVRKCLSFRLQEASRKIDTLMLHKLSSVLGSPDSVNSKSQLCLVVSLETKRGGPRKLYNFALFRDADHIHQLLSYSSTTSSLKAVMSIERQRFTARNSHLNLQTYEKSSVRHALLFAR
jgi:hypothetical protein